MSAPTPPAYQLDIRVSIYDTRGHGRLEVNESTPISAADFLEVAAILSRFHELAEQLREPR